MPIKDLKNNIASRPSSQNAVAAFNIFDPKVIPDAVSEEFKTYGEQSIHTSLQHYNYITAKTAETIQGDKLLIILEVTNN